MQFGLSRVEDITDAEKLENDLGRQEVVCAVQLSMKNQILNIIYTSIRTKATEAHVDKPFIGNMKN